MPVIASLACRARPAPVPVVRDFPYGAGASQRLDLYRPEGQSGRATPIAVMIHGGAWEGGSRADVVKFVHHWTSRRHAVANIEYRLTGEAQAPAAAVDVRNAIGCICAHAPEWAVDPGRMYVTGFSAGAHLAMLSALAPPAALDGPQSRPRAMVSFWGITDVADLLSDGDSGRAFARRWIPGGPGQLELARRLSPIYYDTAGAPALCAVHSVYDHIVPFAHSERLVAKFQKENKPAKLIRLSHRGHAAPPEDLPAIFEEIFHFLDGTGVTS